MLSLGVGPSWAAAIGRTARRRLPVPQPDSKRKLNSERAFDSCLGSSRFQVQGGGCTIWGHVRVLGCWFRVEGVELMANASLPPQADGGYPSVFGRVDAPSH